MSLPADPQSGAIITAAALALAGAYTTRLAIPELKCERCESNLEPVGVWLRDADQTALLEFVCTENWCARRGVRVARPVAP